MKTQRAKNFLEIISGGISHKLERLASKLEDTFIVLWFLIKSTLTVVVMTLIILSPMIAWPLLMGWPEPYCYIAYAIWIIWFFGGCILAAIVGYWRENKQKE